MAQFNHDAPFGIVSPIVNGAAYWQAPNHFDAQHNHVNDKGEVVEYADGQKAPPLRTKESVEVRRERQQRDAAARASNPNTAAKAAEPTSTIKSGVVDLKAWASGEAKGVQWFAVKKQMQDEGYDPMPQSAVDARAAIMARNSEES